MAAVLKLLVFVSFLLNFNFMSCDVISDSEVIDAIEAEVPFADKDRADRDTPVSYQGAQLWRVPYNDQNNKNAVSELQKQYEASMWNLRMANVSNPSVDMFVKRAAVFEAKKFMKKNRVPFDVLIHDIQGAIDTENPPLNNIDLWVNRDGKENFFIPPRRVLSDY